MPLSTAMKPEMKPETHASDVVADYREFPVRPDLADYFLCFWTQSIQGSGGEYSHRVLPDACVDIVLVNDDPPSVVGPWTDSFRVQFPAGTKIVGARLHPGRACDLLGVPATELLHQDVALASLWGQRKTNSFAKIFAGPSLVGRRQILADVLAANLTSAASPDRAVTGSIQWLARDPHGRVEQLSRWLGISNRQLQRRYCHAVGYGPKMLQSVLRFQRLLYLANRTVRHSLADLAAHAGYSDQAHMSREVQRFAACTPAVLLPSAASTLGMSDLFKTPVSAPS
jgi:AraC-like DNA-binding protein